MIAVEAADGDWPQWQGPNRTNLSTETGLLKQWPAVGPAVTWLITNIGTGYGTVAIQGDRIYVQGILGALGKGGTSAVFCLNRADGKTIWTRSLGRSLEQEKGGGPRGTPTVEGERVYALSEDGDLACLQSKDGSRLPIRVYQAGRTLLSVAANFTFEIRACSPAMISRPDNLTWRLDHIIV